MKSEECRDPHSRHPWIFQQWKFQLYWEGTRDNSGYLDNCFSNMLPDHLWHFQTLPKNSYLDPRLGPRNSQNALCFKSSLFQAGQQLLKWGGRRKLLGTKDEKSALSYHSLLTLRIRIKPEENLLPGVTEEPWCWGAVFGHFPIGCWVELQRVFSLQQKQQALSLYHL